MNIPKIYRIVHLLYHRICGKQDEQAEAEELHRWAESSPNRRKIWNRLTNYTFLEQEYRRRAAIDYIRPMKDMIARVHKYKQRTARRWLYPLGGVAAVVLLLIGFRLWFGLYERQTLTEQQLSQIWASQIRPGSSTATLRLANGDSVVLTGQPRLLAVEGKQQARLSNGKLQYEAGEKGHKREMQLNTLWVPRGGEFCLQLSDGTEVWLNSASQITYPVEFGDSLREVTLLGEAYFKVAKDKQRPFVVEIRGQRIEVVGTEFNVYAYRDDKYTYTTLVSGCIVLENNLTSEVKTLEPGYQLQCNLTDGSTRYKKVNVEEIVSWRNGQFVFEEQTLGQIMENLSRWYNFTYEFRSEKLKELVFMGSIPRYSEFTDVMRLLENSGNLSIKIENRCIILMENK